MILGVTALIINEITKNDSYNSCTPKKYLLSAVSENAYSKGAFFSIKMVLFLIYLVWFY